jgi:hypothetical protein
MHPSEVRFLERQARRDALDGELLRLNLPSRRESLAMTLVTGLYLVFELAFAARLLDVVGTTLDPDDIHQIEIAGRFISGIALTLVVWTAIVLPWLRRAARARWSRLRAPLALGASAALCCALSYGVQEAILDGIARASTLEDRRTAAALTLIAANVQDEVAILEGIDFAVVDRSSPEAKSFLALLPALALTTEDLAERTDSILEDLLLAQAEKATGGFEAFYNEAYRPSSQAMKRLYNAWLQASEERLRLVRGAEDAAAALYKRYRNGLGRYRPQDLPRSRHAQVRREVQSMGVPVGPDWVPTDRAGFMSAARREILRQADVAYAGAVEPMLGHVPSADLGPAAFFSQETLQARWRADLGIGHEIALDIDLSPEAFRSRIYDPWMRAVVDERRPLYTAPLEAFATGGAWHEDGITAMRIAWIPLMAFGFSLLGAMVHGLKTMNFAVQAMVGFHHPVRRRVLKAAKLSMAGAMALSAILVSGMENPVTQSDLFANLEAKASTAGHPALAVAMRTVIHLQPFAYPVGDLLRREALFGITYDFDPETPTRAFEAFFDLDI